MSLEASRALKTRLVFVRLFDRLCRLSRWRRLDTVLARAAERADDFFFVQIGANDGVIYDPIHHFVDRFRWAGLLVEPVPTYFDQLKVNYRNHPQLLFEKAALSGREEVREFYRIRDGLDFLPEWCRGLGTFHLDVLLTHKWAVPNIEEYVVAEPVECLTLDSLLQKHSVSKIDLLVIDTEGHDWPIIRQIDFERFRPTVLLFEHQYLSREQRAECAGLLRGRGYTLSTHMGNTLAYTASALGL